MEMEDLEDMPDGSMDIAAPVIPTVATVADVASPATTQVAWEAGAGIPAEVRAALQLALFGLPTGAEHAAQLRKAPALATFNAEWRSQGIAQDAHPVIGFGLLQPKGGPCGALASLQARVLRELYFTDAVEATHDVSLADAVAAWAIAQGQDPAAVSASCTLCDGEAGLQNPAPQLLQAAALLAMARAIWQAAQARAGNDQPAVALVALPGDAPAAILPTVVPVRTVAGTDAHVTVRADGILDMLRVVPAFSTRQVLRLLCAAHAQLLDTGSPAITAWVVSVVLSRGVPAAQATSDAAVNTAGILAAARAGWAEAQAAVDAGVGWHSALASVCAVDSVSELAVDPTGQNNVLADMDSGLSAQAKLIGAHAYATQELVNLLLHGYARSNVHDGDRALGDGPDAIVLRGVPAAATPAAGFLTLFEHYGHAAVGASLKSPAKPIWVVCSESHYTCVFLRPDARAVRQSWARLAAQLRGDTSIDALLPAPRFQPLPDSPPLRLWYYDGLARQDALIEFELRPPALGEADDALLGVDADAPPLELVLRTRWPGADITWHGSEPLL